MKKIICDLCGKEIKNPEDYVEQAIIINGDNEGSADSDICRSCWEKEQLKQGDEK